jgi:hypothetical protein
MGASTTTSQAQATAAATARETARALLDAVGPHGERLAIRIERTHDAVPLAALRAEAHALVASLRGAQAAQAFDARTRRPADTSVAEPAGNEDGTRALKIDVRRHGAHAAQRLIPLLGPRAQPLVLELHAARDAQALVGTIRKARDTVASLLGDAVAASYLAEVLASQHD